MNRANTTRKRGFTLVELLVVIAIVAIMMAWLLSALQKAKDQARWANCLSNERHIGMMITVYTNDYDGYFPVPPLGVYMAPWGDIAYAYMPYLYGGDDIGSWQITTEGPAEVCPLYGYINPESHIYRCPADNGSNPGSTKHRRGTPAPAAIYTTPSPGLVFLACTSGGRMRFPTPESRFSWATGPGGQPDRICRTTILRCSRLIPGRGGILLVSGTGRWTFVLLTVMRSTLQYSCV